MVMMVMMFLVIIDSAPQGDVNYSNTNLKGNTTV